MPHGRTVVATVATSALVLGLLATTGAPAFADGSAATTPTIADSRSSATSADASEIAQAHDHGVTVSDETTPTSLLTANPDGSFTVTQDTIPVRTQQAGQWIPVETDLVPVDQSWIAPKATDTHVRFSRGGTDTVAQVQTDTGAWVSESWPAGGALPSPTIDGATATYADVLPEVDLRLTATPSGMAEVLVVNTPEAAANPDLQQVELQMHGATVSTSSTASTATATDGSTLQSSKPTWWDSSDGGDADGPGGAGSATPLEHTTTATAVTLDVTDATDSAPTFPVFVDPDWSSGQNALWFDDIAYPTQSYLNGQAANGYQSVGYAVENGKTFMSRAFWQFNLGPLDGKHITEAHFNAIANYSCGEATVQAWRYGNVTPGQNWNDDQANQGQWRDHISDAEIPSVAGCAMPGKAVGWDVTRGAAATAGNTLQIGLRSPTEGSLSRKHFAYNATLTIEYNTVPSAPTHFRITSPTRTCGDSTDSAAWINNDAQSLTLSVQSSDPDGENLATKFYVYKASDLATHVGDGVVSVRAAPGTQTAVLPKGYLPDGDFAVRARSNDDSEWGGWSSWCYIHSDSTPPKAPSVTGVDKPHTVGVATSVTATTPTDASIAGFAWWVSASRSDIQPVTAAANTAIGFPDCGLHDGIVTYVCATPSRTATIRFAPTDNSSVLWVKSIDKAGNVSVTAASPDTSNQGWPIVADSDPTVDSESAAHTWTGSSGHVAGDGTSGSRRVLLDEASTPTSPRSLTLDPSAVTSGPIDDTGYAGPFDATRVHQDDLVRINRYYGDYGHIAVTARTRAGKDFQSTLGELLSPAAPAPSHSRLLWSCPTSVGDMTTGRACSDSGVQLGYSWTVAADVPTGTKPVHAYRCEHGDVDYFTSIDPDCEGFTKDSDLGFFAAAGTSTTSGPIVDTTKSYTVSAWLRPSKTSVDETNTAMSLDGQTNSPFYLQYVNGKYRFCVKEQTDTPSVDCTSPAQTSASPGTWAFVTGVWDPANNQVRIMVNASSSGVGVTGHSLGAGERSSSDGLLLGSGVSDGAPVDSWSGDIAMPSITQGVATRTQLRYLMTSGSYRY
ncbi:hypothetical protein ABH929_000677 [Curtobacterium sp. AB7]